jgi:hypothetical protein
VQPRRHPPGLLAAAAAVRRQRKHGGGPTMPKLNLRHDPYIKARCGVDNPEHKQTKPCKRAGSSPVWTARHHNEMFLRRHPRDDNQCWIELWDWDRFGKDDFAGGAGRPDLCDSPAAALSRSGSHALAHAPAAAPGSGARLQGRAWRCRSTWMRPGRHSRRGSICLTRPTRRRVPRASDTCVCCEVEGGSLDIMAGLGIATRVRACACSGGC